MKLLDLSTNLLSLLEWNKHFSSKLIAQYDKDSGAWFRKKINLSYFLTLKKLKIVLL